MPTKTAEQTVRDYLEHLGKKVSAPKPTVNREAVKAVRDRIKAARDPIQKLLLHRELEEAQKPVVPPAAAPDDSLEADFVAKAKEYADDKDISASAFLALKVPQDVLRRAGFTLPKGVQRQAGRLRAPRIDIDDVVTSAKGLGSQWTLKDLAAKLERDVTTTRNYVNKLIEQGIIIVGGKEPSKRGKPANIYTFK